VTVPEPAVYLSQPRLPAAALPIAPLIEARSLLRRLGKGSDSFVFHLDSIRIDPGTCVAVTGPSGCGKSTLLGLLALALRPEPGPGAAMTVGADDALALWHRDDQAALTGLRATRMGFVPQTSALLPFLTLRRNIALPQAICGRVDPAFVDEVAGWLDIAHVLDRRPAQVSVGQRQRAAIARALAHRPDLILADEPTASVHPGQADRIMALLRDLVAQTGTALVATTHDPSRAEAAGFAIAPCEPHGVAATRFCFPAP